MKRNGTKARKEDAVFFFSRDKTRRQDPIRFVAVVVSPSRPDRFVVAGNSRSARAAIHDVHAPARATPTPRLRPSSSPTRVPCRADTAAAAKTTTLLVLLLLRAATQNTTLRRSRHTDSRRSPSEGTRACTVRTRCRKRDRKRKKKTRSRREAALHGVACTSCATRMTRVMYSTARTGRARARRFSRGQTDVIRVFCGIRANRRKPTAV